MTCSLCDDRRYVLLVSTLESAEGVALIAERSPWRIIRTPEVPRGARPRARCPECLGVNWDEASVAFSVTPV